MGGLNSSGPSYDWFAYAFYITTKTLVVWAFLSPKKGVRRLGVFSGKKSDLCCYSTLYSALFMWKIS